MSLSFSINSKPQSKSSAYFSDAADESDSSTVNYIREFVPAEAPPPLESKIKPIAPIPDTWRPNLPQLSQSNGADSALQFEVDPGSNPEASDSSMGYGLNLRHPSATVSDVQNRNRGETISDLGLKKLREDLEKLPEGPGMDEFAKVPVEGFGAALLSGYGWKEGRGIGRNAKGDVKVYEFAKKTGRGGLGFTGELPEEGSSEEKEKCLRELKELKVKEKDVYKDNKDRNLSSVNWLRNHIRVRIISEALKGGRLFLKTGVVVDVLGPGVCDILIDESRELVQGVDQELLETALPKRGGPVIVLYGRHKGVYGSLLEQDWEKEMGVVRDADTHELLNVKLEQIAEYTGDPSDIGY